MEAHQEGAHLRKGEVFDMFFETKFGGPARAEKGSRYYSSDRFGARNVPVSNSGNEKVLFGVRPTPQEMTNLKMNSRAAPIPAHWADSSRSPSRVE